MPAPVLHLPLQAVPPPTFPVVESREMSMLVVIHVPSVPSQACGHSNAQVVEGKTRYVNRSHVLRFPVGHLLARVPVMSGIQLT